MCAMDTATENAHNLDVGKSIEEKVKMRQPSWIYGAPKNDAEQRTGTKKREVWK